MKHLLGVALTCGALGAFAACGGNAPESKTAEGTATTPPTPGAPAASSAAPAGSAGTEPQATVGAPPSKPWKTLSLREKKNHMKFSVMPKMGATFQELDAKKYGDFTCVTCHGNGAKNGTFVMPNPNLPKLSPAGGFKKHMDEKPKETKFMMERILPDMVSTLGVAPFDPKTHQGFGCNGCHVLEN